MTDTIPHSSEATSQTVTLTVNLPRDLVKRLRVLADRTTWDVSDYVGEALTGYIPFEERGLALTEAAIAEIDAGGPTYSNEEVMAWIESWGKPDELPPPDERQVVEAGTD